MTQLDLEINPKALIKCSDIFNNTKSPCQTIEGLGVYIWGFMFPNEKENPCTFYPYYVGQAGGDSNKLVPSTSIKSRLKCHYFFNQPYNVIKEPIFEQFIKGGELKTDNDIDELEEEKLALYRTNFSYLNKKDKKNSKGHYEALNQININKNPIYKTDIGRMQEHMYACWIEISIKNEISERKKIIKELEKYIQSKLRYKYALSGKVLNQPSAKYKFKISCKTKNVCINHLVSLL
jgi:hypothetical protein